MRGTPATFVSVYGTGSLLATEPWSEKRSARSGTDAFDRDVQIEGDAAYWTAILDCDTRTAIRALIADGGGIKDDRVRLKRAGVLLGEEELATIALRLAAIADVVIIDPASIPERLERIAKTDPDDAVRQRARSVLHAGATDGSLSLATDALGAGRVTIANESGAISLARK